MMELKECMRIALLAGAAACLSSCNQQPTAKTQSEGEPVFEIPRQFWGEYTENLADCGQVNETRLRISWNEVRFYESVGKLQQIIRASDHSVFVQATHSGEGRQWTTAYQLELSPDGKMLTVRRPQSEDDVASESVRHRCPAD